MNRRNFLKLAGFAAATVAVPASILADKPANRHAELAKNAADTQWIKTKINGVSVAIPYWS